MIDRTVSHYKILAKLGEGGMGAVYRGVDTMLDRPVAIKILHAHIAHQPDVMNRFRSEAALLAKLCDPNIATLYTFFREGDEFFMVMEFCQGCTLAKLMQSGRAMPPQRAVQIISKVLSGLDHAHSLGILHRDIKPANILISDQSTVKITDFGIARALGSERLTRDLRVVGTPEYLAPERVKGEEGDLRSDLYAVGVVLYELLAGRLPFEHNSDFELMRAHLERAPLPLRTGAPSLPPALEAIVNRALAKRPEDRFANAREMRDALEAVDLKSAAQETRFLEPAAAVPATRFVAVATLRQDAQNGRVLCAPKPGFFARPLVWIGIAAASLFALLLIFIFGSGVNRSAPQPAITQEVRKEAPAPVVVEKPNPPPQAPAVVTDPPPTVTDTQTNEDAAAQQRRAERARRRAAALRALDQ